MKIPFNKDFILIEKEDYANYQFVAGTWEGYTCLPRKFGFEPGRYFSAEFIDSACILFGLKEASEATNRVHFDYFFNQPQKWDKLHQVTEQAAFDLFKFSKRALQVKPNKLSDQQLLKWIAEWQKRQIAVHVPRGPMVMLETMDNRQMVSNYLFKYLQENATGHAVKIKPFQAFQILTAPLKKSNWTREREELTKVALLKGKTQQQALIRHAKKYEWLEYGLQGKKLTFDHFANELKKIQEQNPKKVLVQLAFEPRHLGQEQKRLRHEYHIGKTHWKIFKILQDSFYTRLFSKDAQFNSYYSMEPIFLEFGRRTSLNLEQIRFLAPRDFSDCLLNKRDYSAITITRRKYSVFICDKGETLFFVGKAARAIRKKINIVSTETNSDQITTFEGQPAYGGKAKGRVKIINTIQEIAKMHAGNILVSHMTNPGIVPAMKQSLAIITDLGGITCHAAIIARELKKPCIIGTKNATHFLRDGDLVEVDANKGIVRKIK